MRICGICVQTMRIVRRLSQWVEVELCVSLLTKYVYRKKTGLNVLSFFFFLSSSCPEEVDEERESEHDEAFTARLRDFQGN